VSATLYDLIPRDAKPGNDLLLERFLDYAEGRRLQLYPAQESAILELFEDKNVILNTPTGSGKSLWPGAALRPSRKGGAPFTPARSRRS
jgi:superfamily II RNA helicase